MVEVWSSPEVLPDLPIQGGPFSRALRLWGVRSFREAGALLSSLPFGAPEGGREPQHVLVEGKTTGPTAVAVLAHLAREVGIPANPAWLVHRMDRDRHPAVGPILSRLGLPFVVEVRNVLNLAGRLFDPTPGLGSTSHPAATQESVWAQLPVSLKALSEDPASWHQALLQAVGLTAPVSVLQRCRETMRPQPVDPGLRPASTPEILPLRHRILRSHQPLEAAQYEGDDGPETLHLARVEGDRVVAVGTSLREDRADRPAGSRERRIRGMAVAEDRQGAGLGGRILRGLTIHGLFDRVDAIWLNARARAEPFYLKHGYLPVGPSFEIAGIGPHRVFETRFC